MYVFVFIIILFDVVTASVSNTNFDFMYSTTYWSFILTLNMNLMQIGKVQIIRLLQNWKGDIYFQELVVV